jgi:hypothetical protein
MLLLLLLLLMLLEVPLLLEAVVAVEAGTSAGSCESPAVTSASISSKYRWCRYPLPWHLVACSRSSAYLPVYLVHNSVNLLS